MDDFGLGWLVGILEGEGTFTVNKTTKGGKVYVYPQVAVNSTDEEVPRKLLEITGLGTVCGPFYYKDKPNWKPRWLWTIRGKAATEVMDMAYPHLSSRRQQQIRKSLGQKTYRVLEVS